jgi:predicted dehydrogenase
MSNRREFLKTTAVIGMGCFVSAGVRAAESKSPNGRIAMASIGIAGKGGSDTADAAKHGDLVAICDADRARLDAAGKKYPGAKKYTDFRKMLDEMGKSIDAVTVSTPDHTHAPAALMAMRMGKHCFCQKPLTRTIYEARLMGQVAREKKLATQMGNQGTAGSGLRRAAAWLRAGVLGPVKEVHIWTNRPIWPQGGSRPKGEDPVPDTLDWDCWIGPAPMRPYKAKWPDDDPIHALNKSKHTNVYHPFVWRGWWDFGSGALGDMGCHIFNMPFMGLDLRNPVSVEAQTPRQNREMFPEWAIVTYHFAATANRPALKLVWYEGGKTPPAEICGGNEPAPGGGSLVIGEKGLLWGDGKLVGVEPKEVEFPESPGHFEEWVQAIRGGKPAMSNFPDYAGPLTETVLLGNLAMWAGKRVEWDATAMKAKNVAGLESLVKPTYRKGYTLDG